mgnify:CR=1 FL=1
MGSAFNLVEYEQCSPEWHLWRKDGASASEASVLLGVNPYMTIVQLFNEKTGKTIPVDLSKNPHVIRGNKNEDIARQKASEYLNSLPGYSNFEMLLPICAESKAYPYLRASLDGINTLV